jgi:hypothetical protein
MHRGSFKKKTFLFFRECRAPPVGGGRGRPMGAAAQHGHNPAPEHRFPEVGVVSKEIVKQALMLLIVRSLVP